MLFRVYVKKVDDSFIPMKERIDLKAKGLYEM